MMVIFLKTVNFTGSRLIPGNGECSRIEKQTCNITLTIMYPKLTLIYHLREMKASEITNASLK